MPAGGHREGAGRPKGRKTSPATRLTRRRASAIMESGLAPLDVMMSNLRFWHKELAILEVGVRAQVPEGSSVLQLSPAPGSDSRIILDKYFEAREKLQIAAEKAAPYVHPRLSPVSDVVGAGMRDLSKLTDAELDALERISRKIAGTYGNTSGED